MGHVARGGVDSLQEQVPTLNMAGFADVKIDNVFVLNKVQSLFSHA